MSTNYPDNVSPKDFNDNSPKYTHSFEVELSGLDNDDDHPYSSGSKDLVVDVTVTNGVVEIDKESGMEFLIDQDGGTYKEIQLKDGDFDDELESMIIEAALKYDLNHAERRDYKNEK